MALYDRAVDFAHIFHWLKSLIHDQHALYYSYTLALNFNNMFTPPSYFSAIIGRQNQPGTANDHARAVTTRGFILNSAFFSHWDSLIRGSHQSTRDDIMDLWNNEVGRRDGSNFSISNAITAFRRHYNDGTISKKFCWSDT